VSEKLSEEIDHRLEALDLIYSQAHTQEAQEE
jgi:hypothetical protein